MDTMDALEAAMTSSGYILSNLSGLEDRSFLEDSSSSDPILSKFQDYILNLARSKKNVCSSLRSGVDGRTTLAIGILVPESGFKYIPAFYIIASETVKFLSHNETLLYEENISQDFSSCKSFDLLSKSEDIRLCSGVIDKRPELLDERISGHRVYRSEFCSYLLTKKGELCCSECSRLNSLSDRIFGDDDDDDQVPDLNADGTSIIGDSVLNPTFLEEEFKDQPYLLPENIDEIVQPPVSKPQKKKKTPLKPPSESIKEEEESIEKEDGPFSCDVCFNSFNHRGHFKSHLNSHSQFKNIYNSSGSCPICSVNLTSLLQLNPHIKTVHPEKSDSLCCFVCMKFVKNLSIHLSNTHDSRTVICSKCGKTVRQRYYGEHLYHAHGHKEDRRVICPVCGKIICRKSNLVLHLKIMHSDASENVLSCEFCGKKFPHIKVLKKHIEVHQERKYKCKLCEYKTYRKSNVAVHLKKSHHMKENVYNYVLDTSVPITEDAELDTSLPPSQMLDLKNVFIN